MSRLNLKHIVREMVKTLDDISYQKLRTMLMKHCGSSVPPVLSLMKLMGPERYVKPPDTLMVEHVLSFTNRLPACLQPGDNIEELKKLRDLVQRTVFYASIGEAEVRKSLIEIEETKQTYSEFTRVAIERDEQLLNNESSQKVVQKLGMQDEAAALVLKADRKDQKFQKGKQSKGKPENQKGRGYRYKKDYSNYQCHNCEKWGHIIYNCPDLKKPDSSASGSGAVGTKKVDVDMESIVASSLPNVFLVSVNNCDVGYCERINMSLILNGHLQMLFEFDTAAGVSIIPKSYMKLFNPDKCPEVQPCDVELDLANGQSIAVVGTVQIEVKPSNQQNIRPVKANFMVVDGPHALLGRPLMKMLFPTLYNNILELSGMLQSHHGDSKFKQVPSKYLVAKNVPVPESKARNMEVSVDGHNTKSVNDSGKGASVIAKGTKVSPVKPSPQCVKLPDAPTGIISQEEGAKFCKLIYEAHPALYDGKQGLIKGIKAKINLKPGAEKHLKVMKPAKVSYAAKDGYDKELDKLLETGKIVDGVNLIVASQIVPVLKMKNNEIKVRNTINFKPTINPWIEDEPYNFPTIEEAVDKLNGEYFTCLDIKDAYPHFELEEESQKYLTISTDRGFIQPTRLPQGVKTAPKIFQSYMDKLLAGIPSVACIVDDICVTGKTPAEHFKNLETVVHKLEENGLKVNPKKCQFYLPEVKYLGRIISKDGHKMDPGAMEAIVNMPVPKSRQELQSFLGYLSYVRRHIPDVSKVTPVLSELLKKDVKYVWLDKHEEAFKKCKQMAGNMATLIHYDPNKELVLTTDASPVGLGACLSHRVSEGKKTRLRAIAYASRSLTSAEKNYAQFEREGLAVIWAIKYFRQFVYGRHFYLQTDCSALKTVFGPNYDMGCGAMNRIKRWCVELMEYDFTAQHIKGTQNLICDGLSRLPQPSPNCLTMEDSGSGVEGTSSQQFHELSSAAVKCLAVLPVYGVEVSQESEELARFARQGFPLTAEDISKATREDALYGRVLNAVKTGNFDKSDKAMTPFFTIRDSLSIDSGCLLYGSRIVIPTCQQQRLLFEMHMTHFGVVKMKSLAREYMWWPGINKQIEEIAQKCPSCAKYKKKPPKTPLTHWPWATRPMERLHVDFAEYKGVHLLIVIDAYSKYLWTVVMGQDTTTAKLLRQLDSIFADRGLPTIIVSDNGPQFTSQQFKDHMKSKNINHVLTPPYHPASNGLAEVAVGIVKNGLRKMEVSASPVLIQDTVTTILFYYRMTPNTTTNRAPFDMMVSNNVTTPLSHLRPSQQRKNESLQQRRISRDKVVSQSLRTFNENDGVLVYNKLLKINEKGTIVKKVGTNCYTVEVNGREKLVSADDLQSFDVESSDVDVVVDRNLIVDNVRNDIPMQSLSDSNETEVSDSSDSDDEPPARIRKKCVIPKRRPQNKRTRKIETDKLKDYWSKDTRSSRTRSGSSNV